MVGPCRTIDLDPPVRVDARVRLRPPFPCTVRCWVVDLVLGGVR
jgi:hypothetical protein